MNDRVCLVSDVAIQAYRDGIPAARGGQWGLGRGAPEGTFDFSAARQFCCLRAPPSRE